MPNELSLIDFSDFSMPSYENTEWAIQFSSASFAFEKRSGDWHRTITMPSMYPKAIEWYAECVLVGTSLLHECVMVDPEIRGGRMVLLGTGFTVAQTLVEIADSSAVDEVAENFSLNAEIIRKLLNSLSLLFERSWVNYP